MDAAWIALGGVLLGSVSTFLTARATSNAGLRAAQEARRAEHDQRVRELAADAYTSALEAIGWLSMMHVEDSVDPRFMSEYEPKTERAVQRLRASRDAMTKVAALAGPEGLSRVGSDAAVALAVLDSAWHSCQDYRRKLVAAPAEGKMHEAWTRMFNREWERLLSSRKLLCGFDGSDLPATEMDQGMVLEGSLLHQLRSITANRD